MRPIAALSLALAVTAAAFAACGGTPGMPASLDVVIGGSPGTFTTSTGWHVTLTEAREAIGPIYVYAPDGDLTTRLERALLPVAYAHGGHDPLSGRQVRVEWLEQVAVDLLAPPETVGQATGTAGHTDGLELLLDPPDPPIATVMHGHHAWIAGTATSGTQTVTFEGGLDIPLDSPISRAVEGIALTTPVATGGTLRVNVQLQPWLDQAHFDELSDHEIAAGTQPYVGWFIYARNAASFTADYQP